MKHRTERATREDLDLERRRSDLLDGCFMEAVGLLHLWAGHGNARYVEKHEADDCPIADDIRRKVSREQVRVVG